MKKFVSIAIVALLLTTVLAGGNANAQTVNAPTLYNQSGAVVNGFDSSTNALTPGWYYSQTGTPRYYYANGIYYEPSTQSYGGSVIYPNAIGPQSTNVGTYTPPMDISTNTLTPGVPNTGAGGSALYAWLALLASAGIAIGGVTYLTRSKTLS